MYDLSKHPYFKEYTDPKTGVVSYILDRRVAAEQANLYFTEMGGVTRDEKYMWFRCLDHPSKAEAVGLVSLDPQAPFIRRFNCACANTSLIMNMHLPEGDFAMFGIGGTMYKMDLAGNVSTFFQVVPGLIGNRRIDNLVTHLTLNATGELALLDMHVGGRSYVCTYDRKTLEWKVVAKFMRHYNHAAFSPTDPELFLIDQDWEFDPVSGERFDLDKRMWLMDIHGTRLEPIDPDNWFRHNNSQYCHDFWSRDGWICWPDMKDAVYEYNVYTKEKKRVWARPICHANTLYREHWVGDASPYHWDPFCRVWFFDRTCGKEIEIFSALPRPRHLGYYHIDPHPAFSPKGSYVVSMATFDNGGADVALTPTAPLIQACRTHGTPCPPVE